LSEVLANSVPIDQQQTEQQQSQRDIKLSKIKDLCFYGTPTPSVSHNGTTNPIFMKNAGE
jgi:hypothetical protein